MNTPEKENTGIYLLRKGQKGIIHAIFSRIGLFVALFVLQVLFLFSTFYWFEQYLPHILGSTAVFTAGMVIYLINCRLDSSAKITWLIIIMLFPVFGSLLLIYTQKEIGHRALRVRLNQIMAQTKDSIIQSPETLDALTKENPEICNTVCSKAVYALSKTHYTSLLESGVKIYEYTPGFVHAKVFISDNCKAVIGTINLDYRSLYHHFECAAYLYNVPCISDIEMDFQKNFGFLQDYNPRNDTSRKMDHETAGIWYETDCAVSVIPESFEYAPA